jgi:hypothetical protein
VNQGKEGYICYSFTPLGKVVYLLIDMKTELAFNGGLQPLMSSEETLFLTQRRITMAIRCRNFWLEEAPKHCPLYIRGPDLGKMLPRWYMKNFAADQGKHWRRFVPGALWL